MKIAIIIILLIGQSVSLYLIDWYRNAWWDEMKRNSKESIN